MYTCPEFDLYSVYLDGEMTGPHKKIFTEHLKTCPACRTRVERFQKIQKVLLNDSDSITLSKEENEASFRKLCNLMNYKEVSKTAATRPFVKTLKFVTPAFAAVMIFALMFPLFFTNKASLNDSNIVQKQSLLNTALMSNKGIIIDNSLTSALSYNQSLQKISSLDFSKTNISSIDVFKPALSNDSITIQIKLTSIDELLPFTTSNLHQTSYMSNIGKQF